MSILKGSEGSPIRFETPPELLDGSKTLFNRDIVGLMDNGAIIESGSNANGYYVRYADGTQICWHALTAAPVTEVAGQIFRSNADRIWTVPTSFSGSAAYSVYCSGLTGAWATTGTLGSNVTGCSFRVVWHASLNATPTVRLLAIGRWF